MTTIYIAADADGYLSDEMPTVLAEAIARAIELGMTELWEVPAKFRPASNTCNAGYTFDEAERTIVWSREAS